MISIFKTNIYSDDDLQKIRPHLDGVLSNIIWSVDLFDCDKILRVESGVNKNEEIISVLNCHGYKCINLKTFYSAPSWQDSY